MANNTHIKVTAPYNFIPLSNKVIYNQNKDMSLHGISKNSGELHITYTARTPIYVSNGNGEFIKNMDGKEMIPGSTIRGMVRSNMQILGYGSIRRDIQDYKIYFRNMTAASSSLARSLKNYYSSVLNIQSKKVMAANGQKQSVVSEAMNAKAGYLVNENGDYKIYPVEYKRVSVNHPQLENEKGTYLQTKKVYYKGDDFSFQEKSDWKQGMLLFTGKAVKNPNARYLFRELNKDTDEVIDLTKEDIMNYRIDYTMRARINKEGKELWSLPEKNVRNGKPVFYIRHEGNIYFGMTQFLRIAHKHSITHGTPESHKSMEVTFVEGILGYANEEASMCSRVFFGDAKVVKAVPHRMVQAVLCEPKPSFYAAYLKSENPTRDKESKHYSDEEFDIRGNKRYWMKEFKEQDLESAKSKVLTKLTPLGAGSVFQNIIRYKNLSDEELGLLLWSLQLEEGCYQTIGMGKSLGMGRVQLEIGQMLEATNKYTYDDFCVPLCKQEDVNQYIEKYKQFVNAEVCGETKSKSQNKKKKDSVVNRSPIKDLLYMSKKIVTCEDDIKDMGRNKTIITDPLETVQELRNRWGEEEESKNSGEDTKANMEGGLDLGLLLNKHSHNYRRK